MAPLLYAFEGSPPTCSVLMTAKSIGLNLDIKMVDFEKEEHLSPEYLKLNPQHTVPLLVDDDGFVIWDSHAIMPYIIAKYGKDDSLYPKEVQRRAVVDQRLHFDSGVAWARMISTVNPILFEGKKAVNQEDVKGHNEVYSFVETFLDGKEWIAGDSVTIADYSYINTLSSLDVLVKIDASKYPKLVSYLKRAESLPVKDLLKKLQKEFTDFVNSILK